MVGFKGDIGTGNAYIVYCERERKPTSTTTSGRQSMKTESVMKNRIIIKRLNDEINALFLDVILASCSGKYDLARQYTRTLTLLRSIRGDAL